MDGILTTVPGTGDCATFPVSGAVSSIAVDSHGTVYVSGVLLWSIAEGVASVIPNVFSDPLAIDSKDRLYILSPADEVFRLAPCGTLETYVANQVPGATIRIGKAANGARLSAGRHLQNHAGRSGFRITSVASFQLTGTHLGYRDRRRRKCLGDR